MNEQKYKKMTREAKQGEDDIRKFVEAQAEATLHHPENWWQEED